MGLEFNGSCNCHPSYETYNIPFEWLTMDEARLRDLLRERIRIKDAAEAERKAANEAIKLQEEERREREQLARLKAKYEGQ